MNQYQKKTKHLLTHLYYTIPLINFLHLLQSTASYVFNCQDQQPFPTTSPQVVFGLSLCLTPSTS